ncbi:MAG TPA: hypothetical protein VNH22_06570 [Blastocatellia bacterium]|jgi:cytochrome c5|nr:hypothetical protein [Blastocatellia bacterium]
MKKKDLYFLAMAAAVIGLFVFLSMIGRKAAPMTARAEHSGLTKETPRETCWTCHALDSQIAPMPARHPKKGKPPDQTTPCSACHKYPDAGAPPAFFNSVTSVSPKYRKGVFVWLSQQQK